MKEEWNSVIEKLLIPLLIADIGIATFYYTRISDLLQEIWPGAYNVVFGEIENHQLGGFVFAIILLIIPLIFWGYNLRLENLYFKNVSINSGLTTVLIILGNLVVFLSELGINYIMFEMAQGNILAGVTSDWFIYAGWAMAVLLPIFHQLSANFTVISLNLCLGKT